MNDKKNIQAETRSSLAKMYEVNYGTFCQWIEINPALKKLFAPYLKNNKRTFPPDVVKKTFDILGEP